MNAVAMLAGVAAAPADGPSNGGEGTGAAFGEALGLAGRSFAREQASTAESDDTSVDEAMSTADAAPVSTDPGQQSPADPAATFAAAALLLSALPSTTGDQDAGEDALPRPSVESGSATVVDPTTTPPTAAASGSEMPAAAPAPAIGATPAGPADVLAAAPGSVASAVPGDEAATATQAAASVPTGGRSSDTTTAPVAAFGIRSGAGAGAGAGVGAGADVDVAGDAGAPRSAPAADARVASDARTANPAHPQGAAALPVEQRVRVEGADRAAGPASATPAASTVAPVVPSAAVPTAAPVEPEAAPAPGARAVAAQLTPALLSIAQRPAGTHQLTMTVNPDSLGPVTLRARISAGGDVQVELVGATDAGREALRLIATDLRRDLASVMPHATLSLGQGSTADASGDRSGQPTGGGASGDQGPDRGARRDEATGSRAATEHDLPRIIQTTSRAGVGEGLDIFA